MKKITDNLIKIYITNKEDLKDVEKKLNELTKENSNSFRKLAYFLKSNFSVLNQYYLKFDSFLNPLKQKIKELFDEKKER